MATSKSNGTTSIVTQPKKTPEGERGPVDEVDPKKRVVSVTAIPDDEALAVGTVNTVADAPAREAGPAPEPRSEEYEATAPDGSKVTVVHDLVTGETTIK